MISSLMKEFSGKEAYCLFDDVLPFFKYLKDINGSDPKRAQTPEWPWKSTTVGIITNSDCRVGNILKSLGLRVHDTQKEESENIGSDISFVTTSYHVGVQKPAAKLFHTSRYTFVHSHCWRGISNADIMKVHVGDDLEKDVFGAMGAGWTPVFLDREGKFGDEVEGDKKEGSIMSVTHSVTHEETEISVIRDLSKLRLRLPEALRQNT